MDGSSDDDDDDRGGGGGSAGDENGDGAGAGSAARGRWGNGGSAADDTPPPEGARGGKARGRKARKAEAAAAAAAAADAELLAGVDELIAAASAGRPTDAAGAARSGQQAAPGPGSSTFQASAVPEYGILIKGARAGNRKRVRWPDLVAAEAGGEGATGAAAGAALWAGSEARQVRAAWRRQVAQVVGDAAVLAVCPALCLRHPCIITWVPHLHAVLWGGDVVPVQ